MVRNTRRLPIAAFVAAILAAAFFILLSPRSSPFPRESMVIVGSPMTVLSWNEKDNSVIIVKLPSDMAAEGTHGYGTYSFDAFWRLGEIDKKDGTVLAESMSEALGIPVAGYIGPVTNGQPFSLGNMAKYLMGRYRTNIPLVDFVRLTWLMQAAKPSRVDTYDFTGARALVAEDATLPDGSHQYILLPDRVDARLAHLFEDESVRRETITTSVLNTTDMPALGNHAARLLANIGVSVVTVANDTPTITGCTVTGTATSLKSASARVIGSVLGCKKNVVTEPERADLTVRVGTVYAKRFLPN